MVNNKTLMVVILSIFVAGSKTNGDPDTVSNQNPDTAIGQLRDYKEQTFIPGSNVTLWCGNVTEIQWNELIYIVWNISLQDRKCRLGLSPNLDDTCKDGKRLYNTSDGVSLVIPKISIKDAGFYSCDISYKAGSKAVNVSVSVTNISTKLENENSQRTAVCNSIFKQKAPTLHWEPAINLSSRSISFKNHGRFSMMENRVYLPADVNISELTCVATYTSGSSFIQQKSTLYLSAATFCLRMK